MAPHHAAAVRCCSFASVSQSFGGGCLKPIVPNCIAAMTFETASGGVPCIPHDFAGPLQYAWDTCTTQRRPENVFLLYRSCIVKTRTVMHQFVGNRARVCKSLRCL